MASTLQGSIPVTDANGDQLLIHEFWDQHRFSCEQRFMLSTGEEVGRLCDNAFVIASTGELLIRGRRSGGNIRPVRKGRSAPLRERADRLFKPVSNRAALKDAPECWIRDPGSAASPERSVSDLALGEGQM